MLTETEQAIIAICQATKYRYGHRKVRALLKKEYQIIHHRNTVQAIMQKHGLQCRVKPKRKWKAQGETILVAPDLLQRQFQADRPNQKWVTDITYIPYGNTVQYLSTIIDLYNNEIVAFKLYDHQQVPLVLDTLKEALARRAYPTGVLLHSDQGSVYTSHAFQAYMTAHHVRSSMSRRGNCWDNAVIESFHSTLKSEEFAYTKHHSLKQTEVSSRISHYLHHYNEERIQQKLDYLSPIEYGKKAA